MAVPVQDILIYTAALVLPVVTGALVGHLDTSTFQAYRIQSLCMGVRIMGWGLSYLVQRKDILMMCGKVVIKVFYFKDFELNRLGLMQYEHILYYVQVTSCPE